jgi:adenylate cyclase class 1
MRTLRAGLSQPPGSDLSPLVPLARQTLAFLERGDPDDPTPASEASELAFLLAALLEAGDEAFRLQAIGLLFRLGVQGEVLAVIHLEKLPEDQALVILSNLAIEEKLLFANAFLRRPRSNRPRTGAFALAALGEVVEKNPDELLILLDLLASRHEYPALPLRNALVRGRLGMWLRRLLQMDLSAEQTRYLARVTGRLRDPGLVEKLAARLSDLDEESAEAVCRALAETPGLGVGVVAGPLETLLRATGEPSLAAAALLALARCDEGRASKAAAALLAVHPERIPILAPVLSGLSLAGFGACLRELPPDTRKAALVAVHVFLATALPQRVQAAARAVRAALACPPELGAAFEADLAARDRTALRLRPASPLRPAPAPLPNQPETGLWRRVKGLVGASAPSGDDAASAALRQELAGGGELRERQILWKSLDAVPLAGNRLARCNFKAVTLVGAVFADVVFTDCQFADVDFEQSRWRRVTFSGCRFANCRFSAADFEAVRLVNCDLRLCALRSLSGRNVAMTAVEAMECDFFLSAIAGLSLTQVRFRAVSLARTDIRDLTVRGALFSDCLFDLAGLAEADLQGVRTEGCYFAGSRFFGPTDEPDILGAMIKDEVLALTDAGTGPPLPAILTEGQGPRLLAATVDAVLFSRDIRRRRLAMLANNKRRLAWARRRLGGPGADWLDMLPGLIQAGCVSDGTRTRPAPAARISGYVPDLATTRLLAAHFGRPADEILAIPGNALVVEAIYTIGSTGTVAQTGDSDLDIWVCLDEASAARPDVAAFQDKLTAIAERAGRELGLELHFFVMTVQDIRANRFGYSEEEGYGSAQGCLLKEEFYRTALTLAGKKPSWWLCAPRINPQGYAKAMAGLARAEPEVAADSLDFGCVERIAGDEFFGASLWMIVKSFTSPFKSIMKLGLLEKYAGEKGDPALLCETLKDFVFTNQGGLWRCDPYALLFSEVSRHYRQRSSPGTLELLRQSFLQKTGFDPSEEYLTRSGEAVLDHFFPYAPPATGACPPPPKREAPDDEGGFARLVALGDSITTYLLRAYERLRQHAAALATSGGLTPRDQTMLSRRIAASFGQQVGKIMRLPFLRPGRELFSALEIASEDGRGKETAFCARGESFGPDRKTRGKEMVRQDGSLVRLAAWLVANELYQPGLFLRAGALPAPLALPDVTALLAAVHAVFPAQATFAPPLSWGLEPRRITAALLVPNLLSPREEKRTLTLDVLYATSWGEFFHVEQSTGLESLAVSPSLYLSDSLGLPLDPDIRLAGHAPARCQCQAARMLARPGEETA